MGEQSEKNTKPTERLKFEKTKGCADGAGQEYELKVPALLFLRALQHTQQFRIATNFAEAGAFDDVVIAYKKNDSEKWITCFIQLKHKTSKYPITFRDLTNLKKIGDFNLIKYYKSYTEIKERFRDVSREHPVFQGDYEDSEYVIFTNAKMNPQLSQRHRQSHSISQPLLQVNSEASAVFSFNETSDDDIFQYFKDVSHFKEFLESVDLENISEEELLNKTKQLKTSLSKESLKTIGSITRLEDFRRIKCQLRDLEDCGDFLRNVSFFVDQPNEEQMDGIIQEEIQKLLCTNEIDTISIWKEMYEAISIWWKKENFYLTEKADFWQNIIKYRLSKLSENKRKEMDNLRKKFKKDSLSLPNIPETNIVTKSTLLTCLKICENLKTPHIVIELKSLLTSKEEVLALWPSKWCTTLVVEWEQVEENVDFIYNQHPNKRLIIVSSVPVRSDNYLTDVTNISQLDLSSQHRIEQQEVLLQGFEVTIRSLLTDIRKLSINEDTLLQILTSTDITVGKSLQTAIDHFIPRSITRYIFLQNTIVSKREVPGVLALSGDREENMSNFLYDYHIYILDYKTFKTFEEISRDHTRTEDDDYSYNKNWELDPNLCWFIIIKNSVEYDFLCERHPKVHWIELQSDKKLIWKASKGDISVIQKYIDHSECVSYNQEQMLNIPDRIILIIAEPGMGKTTLVSYISYNLKRMHPSKWVIPVLLNDQTHILEKYIVGDTSLHFMNELLLSAAGIDDSAMGKFLFDNAMDDTKNIVVLLDGVDEINPNYTNTVISLIRYMIKMGISQIWITSRPVMKKLLEEELCVLSHTLLPFSVYDQLSYLENYWTTTFPDIDRAVTKEFAQKVVHITTQNLSEAESKFMGIPLQTKMMAESFQHHLQIFKDKGNVTLPKTINLMELFQQSVKFKYDIFIKEKMKLSLTNVVFNSTFGKLYDEFDEMHIVCSLAVMVPESDRSILRPKEIWRDLKSYLEKLEERNDPIGIVDGIVNNKPHFIHRSFAEYFCALWLMRNYKHNKKFLSKCFYQPELQVMLRMLNYMICENSSLHMAVLNNDINEVKQVLHEGTYIDQKDKCDRTALQIAAFYNYRDIAEELLISGADIYMKDVLGCDALDYAERNKSWAVAELLLQFCKTEKHSLRRKKGKLPVLKQNITDSNYGINALSEAAEKGYLELAKYLQRKGLDLKKTVLNSAMQTALHVAIMNKQYEIVNIILDGGDVHKTFNMISKWKLKISNKKASDCKTHINYIHDINGYTVLMYACKTEDISVIMKLLLQGHNVDAHDQCGTTALHIAASHGNLSTVECLLRHNANINATDSNGETPLFLAACGGYLSVVKYLVDNGALPTAVNIKNDTILHKAARSGQLSVVEYVMDRQLEVNIRNMRGETALHYAAREGHLDIVQCLLSHSVESAIPNVYGLTPLHLAVLEGHLSVIKYLMKNQALFTSVALKGESFLHMAAFAGNLPVVEYLLDLHLDVNTRSYRGRSALHFAAFRGQLSVVECLLIHGANINAADDDGWIALHIAAENGHSNVVEYLKTFNKD